MKYHRLREYHDLIVILIAKGWVYEYGKKHIKMKAPSGWTVGIPMSPSDRRAYMNTLRDIRRVEAIGNESRQSTEVSGYSLRCITAQ